MGGNRTVIRAWEDDVQSRSIRRVCYAPTVSAWDTIRISEGWRITTGDLIFSIWPESNEQWRKGTAVRLSAILPAHPVPELSA